MSVFEVQIEKIVAGGDGLARHEGRVVFVPETAVGERHLVEPVLEKRDYARARSVERLTGSPARRHPPCPYYGECGGCSLMHLVPEVQADAKREILLESIHRATGRAYGGPLEVRVGEALGYRTRLRFHASTSCDVRRLGFRRRGSHEIVNIERCLLASEDLNRLWERLRQWVVDHPEIGEKLASIELQESSTDRGRVAARFVVSSTDGVRWFDSSRRGALLDRVGLSGFIVGMARGGAEVRAGRPFVYHRVGEHRFRQTAGSFFQANRFLLADLLDLVVPSFHVDRVVDLFCGVGFFSLPAAAAAGRVLGIESSPRAMRDARANRRHARRENLDLVRAEATALFGRLELGEGDLVIVDPPRGGLSRPLRRLLGESAVRKLHYVSCDPPAFARDLEGLEARGFAVDSLVLLDMFPNTHHIEIVAKLSR